MRLSSGLAAWLLATAAAAAPTANGRIVYSSNTTTPQHRSYTATTNTFAAATATQAGAAQTWIVDRAAPTRAEHLAGYVTSTGVLYILRWNGTAWSAEWNVTVGGAGVDGRRFDIAYENTSGDAIVVYSNNTTGTNELRYRVWNGATWTAATNLESARLTGTPNAVKLASRRTTGSDELAATIADSNNILTTLIWSGTAWGNEPAASHGTLAGTAGQNDLWDHAYESASGDLFVVLTASTPQQNYRTYSGGTWGTVTSFGTTRSAPLQMVAVANPDSASNQVLCVFNRSASANVYASVWTGTALAAAPTAVGTNAVNPTVIRKRHVAGAWLKSGANTVGIAFWASSVANQLNYNTTINGGTGWVGAATHAITFGTRSWFDTAVDPLSQDTMMLTVSDSASDLFTRQITWNGTALTWAAPTAGSPITATLGSITTQNFAFAYDRFVAAVNGTTTGTATGAATAGTCNGITLTASYTGDGNANNTLSYEYALAGSGLWSAVTNCGTHASSFPTCAITVPTAGASYDIRLTWVDADGVTGTNPQTATNNPIVAGPNCTIAGTVTAAQTTGVTPSVAITAPFTNDTNANNSGAYASCQGLGCVPGGSTAATRGAGQFTATLAGLTCGTPTTVRFTYTDADGIAGTNPQTLADLPLANCAANGTTSAVVNACTQITASATYTNDANGNGSTAFDRGPSGTGPWAAVAGCGAVGGASPRACVDTSVAASSTYYYRATLTDPDGIGGLNPAAAAGPYTTPACVVPAVTPGAPIASVDSCTQLTVSAPYTGDTDANSTTQVEWNTTNSWPGTTACAALAGVSPRSCPITGLANAGSFYIRVTFTDPTGVLGTNPQVIGPFSTWDCRVAPAAPSVAVNSCSQLTVSAAWSGDWDADSTTAVAWSSTGAAPWTGVAGCGLLAGSSPRTCPHSGLTASTNYWYQVTITDADGVNGTNPQVIGPTNTGACAGNLTLSGTPQPTGSVAAGSAGTYVGKLTLASSSGTVTVTELRFANTGTAVAGTDLQGLVVYEDGNANGTYEPGTDTTVVGAATWNSALGLYVAPNLTYPVTSPTAKNLFVTLDVSSGATVGRTFLMNVTSTGVLVTAPSAVNGGPVAGTAFPITAAPGQGGASNAPMVVILNPSDGATVSGAFRVQVQVHNPGGVALTGLSLSKNAGVDGYLAYTFNLVADLRAQYSVGADAAMYETTTPLSLSLGSYSLKVRATNANGSSTSGTVVVAVGAANAGDGNLLVRDNSSQLCLDCHALPTHSSQSTSYNYGSWAMNCRTCHQPHNTKNIFLVKEQIATPNSGGKAVTLYNTTGANSFTTSTGPANPGNGVCEVCHTKTGNAPVTGAGTATFNPASTTVTGTTTGWTSAIVGSTIRRDGDPESAWTVVSAFVSATQLTLAENYRGAAGTATYKTRTARFRNTGDNLAHNVGTNCIGCHQHGTGFGAGESTGGGTCSGCHSGIWDGMTGAVAKTSKHALGNVLGTNDSFTDTALTWGNPLGANLAASRSCVNMCHDDHVHNLPPATTHEYSVYLNASTQAARAATSRTATDKALTDYTNSATGGMCLSCHTNPVDAAHPALSQPAYQASAHNRTTTTPGGAWGYTMHDGSSFSRNCTKCHTSATEAVPAAATSPFAAVHSSDYPSLLAGTTNPAGTAATYVCFRCHGTTGTGADYSSKNIATQVAKTSNHPTNADTVHATVPEQTNAVFGNMVGSSRHVNCLDCHESHQAKAGTHVTPGNLAGPPLEGAWGAQLTTNPAFWVAPTVASFTKKTLVAGTDFEATLCFKCHSSYFWGTTAEAGRGVPPNSPSGPTYVAGTATFTSGSATVTGTTTAWTNSHVGWVIKNNANGVWYRVTAWTSATSITISPPAAAAASGAYTLQLGETDTAREFNPANAGTWATTGTLNAWSAGETAGSFHPVLAASGGNLGMVKFANLVTTNFPWSTTARNTMTCSDCHESNTTTDPNGPHGSTAGFILRGPNTTWNSTVTLAASIPAGTFCLNCHQNTYTNSRFPDHSRSNHFVACFNCHAAIPHGGPRIGMLNPGAGTTVANLPAITDWDGKGPYWQGSTSNRLYLVSYPANGTANWAQNNCGCNGAGH